MSDPIRTTDYDLVRLEEYNGKYSLVSGYEKKDGDFGIRWCKIEIKGEQKNSPIKVPLGDQEHAVSAMTLWLAEFGYKVVKPEEEETPF